MEETSIEMKSVAKDSSGVMFNSGEPKSNTLYCFLYPSKCVVGYGNELFDPEYLELYPVAKEDVKKNGNNPELRIPKWSYFIDKGYPNIYVRPAMDAINKDASFIQSFSITL